MTKVKELNHIIVTSNQLQINRLYLSKYLKNIHKALSTSGIMLIADHISSQKGSIEPKRPVLLNKNKPNQHQDYCMDNHMPIVVWVKLLIHSQTSTIQPLKFVKG